MGSKEVGKLNPLVQPSGAIKRLHVSEASRGGTPPVFIQNPEVPYFDPYNHEFPQTNANLHNQFGPQFTGGWTALHAAAEAQFAGTHENKRPVKADLDEAKFLLDGRGHHVPPSITLPHYSSPPVDVNAAMTKTGLTPIHVAVRAEHKEMVELLLERSARVDIQDNIGWTPIHYACEAGFNTCLEPMIAAGGHNKAGFLTVLVEKADELPELCAVDEISFFAKVRVKRVARSGATEEKSSQVRHKTLNPEWNFKAVFQDCDPSTEFTVEIFCRFVDGQESLAGSWSAVIKDFFDEEQGIVPESSTLDASDTGTANSPRAGEKGEGERKDEEEEEEEEEGPALGVSRAYALQKPEVEGDGEEEEEEDEDDDAGVMQATVQYTRAVDLADSMGTTALMLAADGGHSECVGSLLAANADPSLREAFGSTAASRAGTAGHAAVCKQIEDAGGGW